MDSLEGVIGEIIIKLRALLNFFKLFIYRRSANTKSYGTIILSVHQFYSRSSFFHGFVYCC